MFEYIIFSFLIAIKLLLIGTEPSTDFEVHRNWKAITNTLPMEKWYYDETSPWTLDYPPIFAYMEYILGKISKLFDENITKLDNLNYLSTNCLIYQRLTVILGDFVLFASLLRLSKLIGLSKTKTTCLIILINGFAGLIIVDNMHFQYNTLLYGILMFSITLVLEEKFILGAIIYCVLLNMKHIFIYLAPAYFIYYLKYYVIKEKKLQIKNLLSLGFTIISVFVRSFVPFIYLSYNNKSFEPIIQIFRRLFPFGRGLLHSYWAPNFWAVYSFFDKIIFHVNSSYLHTDGSLKQQNTSSLGLTQITEFNILPNIDSKIANIIVVILAFLFVLKSLVWDKYHIELKHRNNQFIKYLIISSLIFFNFGYQVHEKAFIKTSLIAIVYLFYSNDNLPDSSKANPSDVEINQRTYFYFFMNLVIFVGVFAQMPLIHSLKDYLIKFMLVLMYLIISKCILNFQIKTNTKSKTFSTLNDIINGFAVIALIFDFIIVFSPHINLANWIEPNNSNYKLFVTISNLKEKYQFFPLMVFSVMNAIVVQIIFVMMFFLKED